jgi:hypothetical protein
MSLTNASVLVLLRDVFGFESQLVGSAFILSPTSFVIQPGGCNLWVLRPLQPHQMHGVKVLIVI